MVQLKYPASCLQFEYDPKFPVRGLYYDKQKGCLLKLDFFGSIETDGCFHGRKKVKKIDPFFKYAIRFIL
jgi:5' nucleotidase family